MKIYKTLFAHFGPQHWWPGDTPFEVVVGAVLTQNTNWTNVEKTIANLKTADLLDPHKLNQLDGADLARLIRPAGYYNIKARRLKNLIRWLCEHFDGRIENMRDRPLDELRERLLAVNGVGRETADSILLYALNLPVFVVDAYTARILARHHCIEPEADYDQVSDYCRSKLPADVKLYNECHALLVRLGKDFCRPRPQCPLCPLRKFPHDEEEL